MCVEMSLLNWITLHRSIHHSLLKHFNFCEVNSIEAETGWFVYVLIKHCCLCFVLYCEDILLPSHNQYCIFSISYC